MSPELSDVLGMTIMAIMVVIVVGGGTLVAYFGSQRAVPIHRDDESRDGSARDTGRVGRVG